jgi:hypothetical protein
MFKIRKIASVLASTVMVGSTLAMAAASTFPAPFVQNGSADVAIVYGSNAASTDNLAVVDITSALSSELAKQTATGSSSTSTTITGGDFVKLERDSSKLHLGTGIRDAFSRAITSGDLPVLLADGTYTTYDNQDFDFTQKINVNNLSYNQFSDNQYQDSNPTVGFKIADGQNILNYTLEFEKSPDFNNNLVSTTLPILGKSYYILANSTSTLTLLDQAVTQTISEGSAKQVVVGNKTYDISVTDVSSTNRVKISVDGKTSNSLAIGDTYKIATGVYVGVKDVSYKSKESAVSNAELSIGQGKLVLGDNEVKLNEEVVDGLKSNITISSGKMSNIVINWNAEDDMFITANDSIVMPGFDNLKLSYGGMVTPSNPETIKVGHSNHNTVELSVPLKDGTVTFDLLGSNATTGNFTSIGKNTDNRLVTASGNNLTFDADTDESFVASWTDGKDAESYLLYAASFTTENSGAINRTTLYKRTSSGNTELREVKEGDVVSIGNVDLTVGDVDKDGRFVKFTSGSGVSFNTMYTKQGMKILLPVSNLAPAGLGEISLNSTNSTTPYSLQFTESDKNGNIAGGAKINVSLGTTATDLYTTVKTVTFSKGSDLVEIGESKVFQGFAYSELASKVLWDQDPTQQTVDITYNGGESYGQVVLSDVSASIGSSSGSSNLGSISVKDTDATSETKNLIVVGGSCVNTVAASLLGVAPNTCGADFTAQTGVADGQFLIQTFSRSNGKVATLVAGYNAGDTTNAAKYLTTQTGVDTTAGKKYVGTTETQAALTTA